MITMPVNDLGIQEHFDYTYTSQKLNPEKRIESYLPEYYNNKNIYYTPSIDFNNISLKMNYPIHSTIKNEIEKEGLSIIDFEEDDIEGMISFVFEVSNTEKDINQIEYQIIKKFNLNDKNISLTIF